MSLRNDLFFSITKNEHLHVRVNLALGMSKEVSGLMHMVLVAHGFLLVVFAFKEPYKYGCTIPLQSLLFHNLFTDTYFIPIMFSSQLNFKLKFDI